MRGAGTHFGVLVPLSIEVARVEWLGDCKTDSGFGEKLEGVQEVGVGGVGGAEEEWDFGTAEDDAVGVGGADGGDCFEGYVCMMLVGLACHQDVDCGVQLVAEASRVGGENGVADAEGFDFVDVDTRFAEAKKANMVPAATLHFGYGHIDHADQL